MALPITGSDQQPIVKYNAKSAKWKVDDVLMNSVTMIVDMPNAEVGWMRFAEGLTPAFHMIPAVKLADGVPFPPMPSDVDATGKPVFKRGFRVTVKIADRLAGKGPTVREWASNSLATCRGFNALHDLWLAAPESGDPSKVPVVSMTSVTEITGQYGANYAPVFEIQKWVPRPKDLKLRLDGGPAKAAAADDDPLDDPIDDLIAVPGEPEMRDSELPEDFPDL